MRFIAYHSIAYHRNAYHKIAYHNLAYKRQSLEISLGQKQSIHLIRTIIKIVYQIFEYFRN